MASREGGCSFKRQTWRTFLAFSCTTSMPGIAIFPDLYTEVLRSWEKPVSYKVLSTQTSHYSSILNKEVHGYGEMHKVEETLASYLSPESSSSTRSPVLPSKPVRTTSELRCQGDGWSIGQSIVAVRTRLGWTLQGTVPSVGCPSTPHQCMHTSLVPVQDELLHHVQRLWQLDTVPYRECKEVTRFKQDQEALQLLDRMTLTLEIEGVRCLATPLLCHKDMPLLNGTRDSVLPNIRSVERRLLKDPEKAETY